jgi:hypothetical protein
MELSENTFHSGAEDENYQEIVALQDELDHSNKRIVAEYRQSMEKIKFVVNSSIEAVLAQLPGEVLDMSGDEFILNCADQRSSFENKFNLDIQLVDPYGLLLPPVV